MGAWTQRGVITARHNTETRTLSLGTELEEELVSEQGRGTPAPPWQRGTGQGQLGRSKGLLPVRCAAGGRGEDGDPLCLWLVFLVFLLWGKKEPLRELLEPLSHPDPHQPAHEAAGLQLPRSRQVPGFAPDRNGHWHAEHLAPCALCSALCPIPSPAGTPRSSPPLAPAAAQPVAPQQPPGPPPLPGSEPGVRHTAPHTTPTLPAPGTDQQHTRDTEGST